MNHLDGPSTNLFIIPNFFAIFFWAHNWGIDFDFGVWLYIDLVYNVGYFGCRLISTSYFVGLFSFYGMMVIIFITKFLAPNGWIIFKFIMWLYIDRAYYVSDLGYCVILPSCTSGGFTSQITTYNFMLSIWMYMYMYTACVYFW